MQKRDIIKINTVFKSDFITGNKRANKSIAKKNSEFFRSSDLHECYELRVVEPILISLEKFQKRDK